MNTLHKGYDGDGDDDYDDYDDYDDDDDDDDDYDYDKAGLQIWAAIMQANFSLLTA
jgi:hypothetical protein